MQYKVLLLDFKEELCTQLNQFQTQPYELICRCSNDIDSEPLVLLEDIVKLNQMGSNILCIGSNSNTELVLKAYELGVSEFIDVSVEAQLVVRKIEQTLQYVGKVRSLSIEELKLTELVNTTMMQSSFYGACLDLVSELQFVENEENIALYLFDFMQQHGIASAITFNSPGQHLNYNQQTFYCSPLEEQVFELLKGKGRIYEFGHRAVFNSPCVSVLIKNMPDKDSVNYGLLIDVFAKLIPAIEMSYINMLNKRNISKAQDGLTSTIEQIKDTVMLLQQNKQHMVDKMVLDIGLSFHKYEFTDAQEAFLSELLENNVVKQTENSEQFFDIYQQLEELVNALKATDVQPKSNATAPEAPSFDVELF